MPKLLNVEEDNEMFEKFYTDVNLFLEKEEMLTIDFAYVLNLPNEPLMYQWLHSRKFPQLVILKCCIVFPESFDINRYLNIGEIKKRYKDISKLNAIKKQRKLEKHPIEDRRSNARQVSK